MNDELRLRVGALSGLVILLFCFLLNARFGLVVLLGCACVGLLWAIPRPSRPPDQNPVLKELLEEAMEIARVREEHGDAVADDLSERLQQRRSMEVMR